MNLHIEANFSDSISFSYEKSLFILISSLNLVNETSQELVDFRIEVSSELSCFELINLEIQHLAPHSSVSFSEVSVELKADFFRKLADSTECEVFVRVIKDDQIFAQLGRMVTLIQPCPRLSLIYDRSINYAFQQNAIPVVKELRLQNNGLARKDLLLRVTTEPAFAPTVEIRLQAIDSGGDFHISPLDLKLSHDFLADLKEKVTGWLKVEMFQGGELIQSITEPISLLARNEWCGLVALPEILAAFVLPNDPAVMTILGRAADILKAATGNSDLNGYQDKSRTRAWDQAAAIYKAIAELGIRYINPPASFESTGQKVLFPSEIVNHRLGTCLDLALLFAACFERVGLRPFIFMHEGHAYSGLWLEERSLPEPAGDSHQQVRKDVDLQILTAFETTLVTNEHPGNLSDARLLCNSHLNEQKENVFLLALDVYAARSSKISPLPIACRGEQTQDGSKPIVTNDPSLGPNPIAEPISLAIEQNIKPSSRIDMWKSRLLDLTLRNRLLNFRETKSTIRLLAEPEHLEDALATERELTLCHKPKLMSDHDPRNADTYTREKRADALKEHLRDELKKDRLHTHLEDAEHAKRLTELFRAARNSLDENGTNTLFAAVGVLEWRETKHSERVHRAPLLLIPVELKRKSVIEGYTLRRIDEETRLNFTLMEMLRQNFKKEIAGLDSLPEDENGVNVDLVLNLFRDAVRDLPGWEVKQEVLLGQFSFTKFLLWKDLTDRLDDLTKNRIVNHLINDAGTLISNPSVDVRAEILDDSFHPSEILCPRSADSSQLAAIIAASKGLDFVLEGPPGTGKSQTIANMIANLLAAGKRVLFVAEKRAALEVVHRRLREDGLEPFCLELHSNKAGKTDVLAQFDQSLKLVEGQDAKDWKKRAGEMHRLRSQLNDYSRALHKYLPCGLSAYQCLDYLLVRQDEICVKLDKWKAILETKLETLEHARDVARKLHVRSRSLIPLESHNLAPLACQEWSPPWEERAFALNTGLAKQTIAAINSTQELLKWMKLDLPLSRKRLQQLDRFLATLLTALPVGPSFATTQWTQVSSNLKYWIPLIRIRGELREDLSLYQSKQTVDNAALLCEAGTQEKADLTYQKAAQLHEFNCCAQESVTKMLGWLKSPNSAASRKRLINLVALAECLLDAQEVGAAFAITPWHEWSVEFDEWISLVKERQILRMQMTTYDESKLLSLDLDFLIQKWDNGESSWWLPKMLSIASVKRQLKKSLPPKTKPDVDTIRHIIKAAIRVREINLQLASIYNTAEKLLGKSWCSGEPDSEQIQRIRSWGENLHGKLTDLAENDAEWLSVMRDVLSKCFQFGAEVFAEGTRVHKRLVAVRDTVSTYETAFKLFAEEAKIERSSLDAADDHLPSVSKMLEVFLKAAPRIREINCLLSAENAAAEKCLGTMWSKGEPDPDELEMALQWGEVLHPQLRSFAGDDLEWFGNFRKQLSILFAEGPPAYNHESVIGLRIIRFREQWSSFNEALDLYSHELQLRRSLIDQASDHLTATHALTERVAHSWEKIREWCLWQKIRQQAINIGMSPVVEVLESSNGSEVDAPSLFERSFRKKLLFSVLEKEDSLREFFGSEHNERIARFRVLDEQLSKLSKDMIRIRLAGRIPRGDAKNDVSREEIGLLRKEIGKKTRHIPVRQLIGKMPTLLPRLKPCLLMSPLSVAQYLASSHEAFDVVIFDEASQIPVWDAIGAIARGSQLIVVGDPKQLPPTNFFANNSDDEDDLTPEEHKDLESILDELMTHGLRHKRLAWHYRSRHEGLITFSNRQYYENALLTFPSPEMKDGGVRFRYVKDAQYDKGKSRTNRMEAAELVEELVSRLRNPNLPTRSYGVVTFSRAQQTLVENLLDEERRKFPEIEHHFGDEAPVEGEAVFVKNLENVQGDERDVILFSICYGFDEAGKLSMNFGPLNRVGGERRLNVAVTRAKYEILVFSGLRGDQIDLTRSRARGVRDLKYFLEFAERGHQALVSATSSSHDSEAESEFERMVADRIREAGFDVHYQVGCSGYRIDLGIIDPRAPGKYLLGVECDGATYHRAATARDRDKLRQAVLEGLGWKLHRIWSTDWWHNANAEMEKLLFAIKEAAALNDAEHTEAQTTELNQEGYDLPIGTKIENDNIFDFAPTEIKHIFDESSVSKVILLNLKLASKYRMTRKSLIKKTYQIIMSDESIKSSDVPSQFTTLFDKLVAEFISKGTCIQQIQGYIKLVV